MKECILVWLLLILLCIVVFYFFILDEIKWGKIEDKFVLLDKVLDLILVYVFFKDNVEEDCLVLLEDFFYYVLEILMI